MTMRGIECCFIATLSTDPVLKTGKNGKQFCNFSCTVAVENGDPQWANVICFGENAEQIAETAKKGDRVYVEGVLSLATWTNAEGESRSGLAVSATKVQRLGLSRVEPAKSWISLEDIPLAPRKPRRPPRTFGLFRRAKKAQKLAAQESADNGRPFDDPLDF